MAATAEINIDPETMSFPIDVAFFIDATFPVGVSVVVAGSFLTWHCDGTLPKTRSTSVRDANVRLVSVALHAGKGTLYTQLQGAKSRIFLAG